MANVYRIVPVNDSNYTPPMTISALRATLAYTDAGTPKALFTIPAGAVVTRWVVNVTTAFNSSGTDLLDIGVSGTQEKYAADLNIAATGQIATGFVVGEYGAVQASAQAVTALYTQSVADANAGAAVILCEYYIP